jgi:nucleoside-diphosphate-sugar epimerase
MFDCGVNGTKNIAEAAQHAGVKRVIYISSFSVYDYFHSNNGDVIKEGNLLETQGEKRGISSWAKRQAEDIALSHLSDNDSAWTILRPSLIFGNGRDLPSLVGPKIGNFLISFGSRKKHLKLIHVRDVAKAILSAIKNNSTKNRIFNISHAEHITVKEIVQECFKKSSLKKYHIIYIPYSIGLMGIVILKILKIFLKKGPSMNRVRLAYLCKDLMADSKAFSNMTGWQNEDTLLTQLMKEAKET